MRPRVLHVIRRLDVPRGAERLVAEIVRTQPNHDVLVFDGDGSFYRTDPGRLHRVRGFWQALRFCRNHRADYDVFDLHMVPACYLALYLGRQAVIHVHNSHYSRWEKPHIRALDRMTYRRAGPKIAVSEDTRTAFQKTLGTMPDTHALPNFAANLQDSPAPAAAKPDGRKRLLMVASLARPKRQDLAIATLACLPETFELVLAGSGADEAALRDLAKDRGLADRVTFAGAVADLAPLYRSADLALLLSDWEGFGLVVTEAAQFGLPTVVNDVDGLRASCPDPRLIAPDLDPKTIADTVQAALEMKTDQALAQRLEDHWRAHDVDSYVSRLEVIYRGA